MSVRRVEIGLVSNDASLVGFYRDAFALTVLKPRSFPAGTVERLGADEALVKIMVPTAPAATPPPLEGEFWTRTGLQYFTLWVDELVPVLERCTAQGGQVIFGPVEIRIGLSTALVKDPDGNVIEVMAEAR